MESIAGERFSVFRSDDRGVSWTEASAGLASGARIQALCGDDRRRFAGTDAGLFRSLDGGRSWLPVELPIQGPVRILSLALQEGLLWIGTDGRGVIGMSLDGEAAPPKVALPLAKVRSLLVRGQELFVGVDPGGVLLTQDGGGSWRRLDRGWPPGGQPFALALSGDRIHAGLYSQGLFRWTSDESGWERVDHVTPLALASVGNSIVVGHNPGGLRTRLERESKWITGRLGKPESNLSLSPIFAPGETDTEAHFEVAPVWEMGSDATTVLAGADAGIYRSADRGLTWFPVTNGLPAKAPGIAFWIQGTQALAAIRRME